MVDRDLMMRAAENIFRNRELFRNWAWAEPDPETAEGRLEIKILELYREREGLRAKHDEDGIDRREEIDAITVEMEELQREFSSVVPRGGRR